MSMSDLPKLLTTSLKIAKLGLMVVNVSLGQQILKKVFHNKGNTPLITQIAFKINLEIFGQLR